MKDFKVELPFGAPPILPDVQQQIRQFIVDQSNLPINDLEASQIHWSREVDHSGLLHFDLAEMPTTLRMNRDPTTGLLLGSSEVLSNGFELRGQRLDANCISDILNEAIGFDLVPKSDLLVVPPSFSRGFDFNSKTEENIVAESELFPLHDESQESHLVDLTQLLRDQKPFLSLLEDEPKMIDLPQASSFETDVQVVLETLAKDVELKAPILRISDMSVPRAIISTDWAEVVDVSNPVADFAQRIPNLAFKYDFELDNFQKQAILKLEERCNVLVSAHTSAGKTVVAEYAIALSQRHMTRAIYTSPIKALSNQKYREFRNTFQDVGLITGDFQVNATGTCLVMTTEILRSMLLAHNDVIRDLEYAIFDEVHYINDMDRGHVWEEVVILLPPHVSIVMLSATIPNALQFADWVGRTKQRRMYVVSTLQRPVPLKHFLYTGSGGSSKDERFLLLDSNTFKRQGYLAAVQAKEKRQKRKDGSKEAVRRYLGAKQESTMWVALLEHLLARDELPVIAFTLSRKRCDQNAEALSLDLTTNKEKSHIKMFFQTCIQRLNQSDRELPQVVQMQRLLERGIGVHHSGILPILKEIVELLFQERCVKVLFATETFAMGVNMPAKTVIFDSIYKYDGLSDRLLLPSEYIQMAGRAGRRGLDENGNVLLVCKGGVPSEQELLAMMTGQPRKIESQFRLTYTIILKLERKRVTAQGRVTVEEMMANSFMEVEHTKKKTSHEELLRKVDQTLQDAIVSTERNESWDKLKSVAELGLEFLDIWHELSPKVIASKNVVKLMTPGRVLLVTYENHVNKLGLLLSAEYKKDTKFRVLVLDETDSKNTDVNASFHKVLALTDSKVYVPSTLGGHAVLNIGPWDVVDVTSSTIKVDAKIVLNDWENRQIPRFKDNPPGQSFKRAVEDLLAVTHEVQMSGKLDTIPILKDVSVSTDEEFRGIKRLSMIREKLAETSKEDVVGWEQQLQQVFRISALEKEKETLTYLLSYQSMSLYSDYQNRLAVLRELGYVDNRNSVQMKGNVACEMSNYELLITELVLRNTLNPLQPAEIAALLSCFIYQGKDSGEQLNVSPQLEEAIIIIKALEKEITLIERRCEVRQADPFGPEKGLNFDLVPVVYEWALDKPFSQIMELTDVQEGIIVRCIQQLNETIRDVKDAARIIGEPTLQQKMEEASNAIKRDIVFAASLYMQ